MKIVNHLLPGGLYARSPNIGGALINPTLLVMHYTGSGRGGKGDAEWLSNPVAAASAHVVVDAEGAYYQVVPFNVRARHAGASTWRGRANCNSYSIGTEVDNWGLLTKREDGTFRSHTGVVIPPENVIHRKNKRGVDGYWEAYTPKQLEALDALTAAILSTYPTIREVVGHEDVAPVRKIDPGPAFPLDRYNSMVGGRTDAQPETRVVTASALMIRAAANPAAAIVGRVVHGERVLVGYDAGAWSQIVDARGAVLGWVADQYLAVTA